MLKKLITLVISLCLIFGISVMAENTVNNENIPTSSSERPMRGNFDPSKMPQNDEQSDLTQRENSPFRGQMPEGMDGFPGNMQNGQNTAEEQPTGFLGFVKTYSTPITSVVLLGLGFIFVIFYRRKNY